MKVKALVLTLLAAGMGAGLVSGAHAADADRIQALEKQLQMLQKEITEIKASSATKKEVNDLNDQVVLQGKESVVAGDIPNSFRMPGSDTSVRLYGYAEMNMIRDGGSYVTGDRYSLVGSQPLKSSSPKTGMTQMVAQTSRFGIETTTPTANGPFNTKIEADFANGDGTTSLLRLRHAYGEYAGFLIGQTWSTFMDGDNFPETVDFNGPPGATFSRPVQVRYTYNVPDLAKFQVAVEANSFTGTKIPSNTVSTTTATREVPPSLVLRADKTFFNGAALSVRAIQHTEVDETTGLSAVGYGFGVSGLYKITDTLTGFAQYTQAETDIGGNLIVGANTAQVVNGNLKMDRSRGVVLGLNNVFNAQWRASLAYGRVDSMYDATDDFATASLTNNKSLQQWHLNAYYTPVKSVDLGVELIGGWRNTYGGDSGELSRVNLLARYTFN